MLADGAQGLLLVRGPSVMAGQGLTYIARHVIGYQLTPETRVHNACPWHMLLATPWNTIEPRHVIRYLLTQETRFHNALPWRTMPATS